jgi:uracil DNA glycosylase
MCCRLIQGYWPVHAADSSRSIASPSNLQMEQVHEQRPAPFLEQMAFNGARHFSAVNSLRLLSRRRSDVDVKIIQVDFVALGGPAFTIVFDSFADS